ncbi:MAG: site-specific integrase [Prevotella sp.]|jgi:integrase|nr:site-specific integrase [Prevotella sp.]
MTVIKIMLSPQLLQQLGEDIVIQIDESNLQATDERQVSLFCYMAATIRHLKESGHVRTSETYACALRSIQRYLKGKDIGLSLLTDQVTTGYESFLKGTHVSLNTISFYMRILRAVYNRAVKEGIMPDQKPFDPVYTGIAKTVKRAISLSMIRQVKDATGLTRAQCFARDMFLFSFYTRGMSFVDMALLRKDNLKDGFLVYQRKKTGQTLRVRWKGCIQEIVDRNPSLDGIHLLPIIDKGKKDERKQYQRRQYAVHNALRIVAQQLGLSCRLTMYVARHSWASIAKELHVPLSVISDSMGHTSERTTQIYLNSIDASQIDDANDMILERILQ